MDGALAELPRDARASAREHQPLGVSRAAIGAVTRATTAYGVAGQTDAGLWTCAGRAWLSGSLPALYQYDVTQLHRRNSAE